MKVRYTRQALLDLGEIYGTIAAENAEAANRVVNEIEREIQRLIAFPRLGRPGRVDETRELVISRFPYVVAYRDHADEIQILSVIHSARAWPESF